MPADVARILAALVARTNGDRIGRREVPMKALTFSALTLGLLCNGALGGQPAPEPTPFEAFASKPSAQVQFTQQVGAIDSSDAKVKVTALVVDDIEHPTEQMRGVRFDLENNSARDQVYLDEGQLGVVRRQLGGMEKGLRFMDRDAAPYNVFGTQSCWMQKRPLRILCPDYYAGPDHSGLRLRSYGGPLFEFPDRKPSELAELIDRATAALEKR